MRPSCWCRMTCVPSSRSTLIWAQRNGTYSSLTYCYWTRSLRFVLFRLRSRRHGIEMSFTSGTYLPSPSCQDARTSGFTVSENESRCAFVSKEPRSNPSGHQGETLKRSWQTEIRKKPAPKGTTFMT
ncbi:Uncharacterized protein HZ326_8627 [Fusarium oxysporum f. sp. albedinis]|nr:Uncharacterized protein HZ326_8627 [Fusarium oxysporum f. sp. albedinis]